MPRDQRHCGARTRRRRLVLSQLCRPDGRGDQLGANVRAGRRGEEPTRPPARPTVLRNVARIAGNCRLAIPPERTWTNDAKKEPFPYDGHRSIYAFVHGVTERTTDT